MFLSIKGMAPLVEKNKQLTKKVKSLESSKKKLEERNRLLGEDNTRLVSRDKCDAIKQNESELD